MLCDAFWFNPALLFLAFFIPRKPQKHQGFSSLCEPLTYWKRNKNTRNSIYSLGLSNNRTSFGEGPPAGEPTSLNIFQKDHVQGDRQCILIFWNAVYTQIIRRYNQQLMIFPKSVRLCVDEYKCKMKRLQGRYNVFYLEIQKLIDK